MRLRTGALGLLLLSSSAAQAFVLGYGDTGTVQSAQHRHTMEELLARFRAEHPGTEIRLSSSTDDAEADAVVVYRTTWPNYLEHYRLRKLSEILPVTRLEKLRRSIRSELWRDYYGRGVQARDYALPLERSFPALLVNLEKLPSLRSRKELRWDELFAALEAASKAPGARPATLTLPLDYWTVTYVLSNALGGPIITDTRARLASDAQVALVRRLGELKRRGLVLTVPAHTGATVDFIGGGTAAALATTSSLATTRELAKFPFSLLMPPYQRFRRLQTGGTDLVVLRPAKDLAAFLEWLYSPPIHALWAARTGYLPLVKGALAEKSFRDHLSAIGPTAAYALANKGGWSVYPFHKFERFCHFEDAGALLSAIFATALEAADPKPALSRGEEELSKLLNRECPASGA